jgi:hypothetical protein
MMAEGEGWFWNQSHSGQTYCRPGYFAVVEHVLCLDVDELICGQGVDERRYAGGLCAAGMRGKRRSDESWPRGCPPRRQRQGGRSESLWDCAAVRLQVGVLGCLPGRLHLCGARCSQRLGLAVRLGTRAFALRWEGAGPGEWMRSAPAASLCPAPLCPAPSLSSSHTIPEASSQFTRSRRSAPPYVSWLADSLKLLLQPVMGDVDHF